MGKINIQKEKDIIMEKSHFLGGKEVMEINQVLIMEKNIIIKKDILNIKEIDLIREMMEENIKIINTKIIIIIIKK